MIYVGIKVLLFIRSYAPASNRISYAIFFTQHLYSYCRLHNAIISIYVTPLFEY